MKTQNNDIKEIMELVYDADFRKFCCKVAQDAGITIDEWNDSGKKTATMLQVARLVLKEKNINNVIEIAKKTIK